MGIVFYVQLYLTVKSVATLCKDFSCGHISRNVNVMGEIDMKSSRFGNIRVILLVCTLAFWTAPAESGWLDKLKDSTKKLQEVGEKALKLEKTEKDLRNIKEAPSTPLQDSGTGTPATAPEAGEPSTTSLDALIGSSGKMPGFASVTGSAGRDIDVVRVKPGMTVSEVQAAIKEHHKDTGFLSKAEEQIFIKYRLDGDIKRVRSIHTYRFYFGSKRPTPETVKATIEEKYGKPTNRADSNNDRLYIRAYDLDGKPIKSFIPIGRNCRRKCGVVLTIKYSWGGARTISEVESTLIDYSRR